MNKQDLINTIAEQADLSKGNAESVLNIVGGAIGEALTEGHEVTLPGVGKFKTAKRAARTARNPKTGETLKVKARTVVKFVPAKSLKEAVA